MAQGSTQYQGQEPEDRVGSDFKEKATEGFERLSDTAADRFGKAADTVESAASRVAAQGQEAGHQLQEAAGNVKSAVTKSVQNQPMVTLALAAAVGFVLGALWKS